MIRDSLFFRFVNRARDPPCTTLVNAFRNFFSDQDASFQAQISRTRALLQTTESALHVPFENLENRIVL